jgi:hypothetical protein
MRRGPPTLPRPAPDGRYGPVVRVVWIVAIILLVVALGAWSTTCTGPRPRPTGDTIPTGASTTVGVAP